MNAPNALVAAACAFAISAFAGEPGERRTTEKVDSREGAVAPARVIRRCYGGFENGKAVVLAPRLNDAETETTLSGCRIGGGATGRAPQSPTIAVGRPVVA